MSKSTVFVVDDSQDLRCILHFVIETAGFNVELHANAQEFLDAYDAEAEERPGCIILDMRMPGMSGLELQKALKKRNSLLPLIFLSGYGDVATALTALKRGAFEFLEKPFDNHVLVERIRHAIDLNVKLRRREARLRELNKRLAKLKPQERDILNGIVSGQSNKVMAAIVGVTTSTIEKRRRCVMRKMEAQTAAELIRMGLSCRNHLSLP